MKSRPAVWGVVLDVPRINSKTPPSGGGFVVYWGR